jgi:DNA-binding beta-propeller fold protein YncE
MQLGTDKHTKAIFLLSLLLILLILPSLGYGEENKETPNPIKLIKTEIIDKTCWGVKAIIAGKDDSRFYSINLEGLSVYEFNRETKKILRKLTFVAHPGKGYNYDKKEWFDSYQEKPVEALFTHGGRYLWLSLHNAGGVVVWDLEDDDTFVEGRPFKEAWLHDMSAGSPSKKKIRLLWIKTNTTPKVIAATPDNKYLFVSNWHSNTVSVLDISSPLSKEWVAIKELGPSPIPRGMVASADSELLYLGQMGSDHISVIDLESFKKLRSINVGINPRHLIRYGDYIYCSLNLGAKLVKIDTNTEKVIKKASTGRSPRTISITKDGKYVFVTCYNADQLQAFDADSLELIGSWESKGHPVASEVFREGDLIEVWVGNHTYGTVKVFTFQEVY